MTNNKEIQEVSDESVIEGLMLLGRTREEAIKEIKDNEEKQLSDMFYQSYEHDFWEGIDWNKKNR